MIAGNAKKIPKPIIKTKNDLFIAAVPFYLRSPYYASMASAASPSCCSPKNLHHSYNHPRMSFIDTVVSGKKHSACYAPCNPKPVFVWAIRNRSPIDNHHEGQRVIVNGAEIIWMHSSPIDNHHEGQRVIVNGAQIIWTHNMLSRQLKSSGCTKCCHS